MPDNNKKNCGSKKGIADKRSELKQHDKNCGCKEQVKDLKTF